MIWTRCMPLPEMKHRAAEQTGIRLHYRWMYRIRLMKRFLNIMGSQQCFHTERMWWWSSSQRMPGFRTLKTDIMKQTSQRKSNFQQFMRMRRARRRPLEFWIRFIDTRLLLKRRNWNGATRSVFWKSPAYFRLMAAAGTLKFIHMVWRLTGSGMASRKLWRRVISRP